MEENRKVEAHDYAKKLFDEHAHQIARGAIEHLKTFYPAALGSVPKSAERSLRNSIKADIRRRLGPLISVMTVLEDTWGGDHVD